MSTINWISEIIWTSEAVLTQLSLSAIKFESSVCRHKMAAVWAAGRFAGKRRQNTAPVIATVKKTTAVVTVGSRAGLTTHGPRYIFELVPITDLWRNPTNSCIQPVLVRFHISATCKQKNDIIWRTQVYKCLHPAPTPGDRQSQYWISKEALAGLSPSSRTWAELPTWDLTEATI